MRGRPGGHRGDCSQLDFAGALSYCCPKCPSTRSAPGDSTAILRGSSLAGTAVGDPKVPLASGPPCCGQGENEENSMLLQPTGNALGGVGVTGQPDRDVQVHTTHQAIHTTHQARPPRAQGHRLRALPPRPGSRPAAPLADAFRHADYRGGGVSGCRAWLGRVRGWTQRRADRRRPADGALLGDPCGKKSSQQGVTRTRR